METVMNARRSTIVLILRFVMNTVSANSHLDQQKMHDLDHEARVEVTAHHEDHRPVDLVLVLVAEATTATEVLNYLPTDKVMNVRRSTIVLIPRSVMNMESANSHLDQQRMLDLDQKAKVE